MGRFAGVANTVASLLSQPGIPKLRRAAKQKLRFRGKGHEVCLDLFRGSDVND